MGFSVAAAAAIIGVSVLMAIELIVGTTIPTLTDVHDSFDKMRDRSIEQIQSDINITSVSTPSNASNYDLNFTVTNKGSTSLDVRYFDVLVNGTRYAFNHEKDFLYPEKEIWLNVTNLPDTGMARLKVVTNNGISDYYEYTIT